jgi:hypothetical protein
MTHVCTFGDEDDGQQTTTTTQRDETRTGHDQTSVMLVLSATSDDGIMTLVSSRCWMMGCGQLDDEEDVGGRPRQDISRLVDKWEGHLVARLIIDVGWDKSRDEALVLFLL